MKRLLLVGIAMTLAGSLWAYDVWLDSFTATADTTANLCTNKRGLLHSVVVSSAIAGTDIKIYASSGTVDSTMTIINTASLGQYFFDVVSVATNTAGNYDHTGLTYSKQGLATVQILYSCQ
jgi:hypothetical protein